MGWETVGSRASRSVRLNWPRLVLLVGSVGASLALLRWGAMFPKDTFPRDAILVLTGTVVGGAASAILDLVNRAESYRQGAYTERAKAVQAVLREARIVKSVYVWRRKRAEEEPSTEEFQEALGVYQPLTSDFYENLPNWDQFHDRLLNTAFDNSLWIGERGVQAVRDFNKAIRALDPASFSSKEEAETAVNGPFKKLVDGLSSDLGALW